MEEIVRVFDRLIEEGLITDYAVGGGVATLFYTEPFATIDVDVFIMMSQTTVLIDLSPIYSRLMSWGYKADGPYVLMGDTPVQLLVAPSTLEEEAMREALPQDFEGRKIKVFRPEHLIAIYLKVYRPKDRWKIEVLLSQAEIDPNKLETIIAKHDLGGQWTRYKSSVS